MVFLGCWLLLNHPLSPPLVLRGWGLGNHLMFCAFMMQWLCLLTAPQTTPMSEQHLVLFPSNFGTLVLLSPAEGGGGAKMHLKGGAPPLPGRPAYAQPLDHKRRLEWHL